MFWVVSVGYGFGRGRLSGWGLGVACFDWMFGFICSPIGYWFTEFWDLIVVCFLLMECC